MKIPEKYNKLIGTEIEMFGNVFNQTKEYTKEVPFKGIVKGVRFGSANVYDFKKNEMIHPSLQFLLKNDDMKRAQWCKSFPCPEIDFRKQPNQ